MLNDELFLKKLLEIVVVGLCVYVLSSYIVFKVGTVLELSEVLICSGSGPFTQYGRVGHQL